MVKLGLMCFTCVIVFGLVPSARTGHHELRRELASVKEIVTGLEKKLDSAGVIDFGVKISSLESSFNSLLVKVSELNRKSQLLSEIHQDNDARKGILQRISRSLEELGRKQLFSVDKKNDVEIERLDKLSENVQALFQIFGGMNRKLDDLQTRIERMPNVCPTSDLKFFITKKIDSLTASTALLSECLECDRESLKDVLHSFLRQPLDAIAKKCSPGDIERSFHRVLDSKWKDDSLHFKVEGLVTKLDKVAENCQCTSERVSRLTAHDIAYSHDTQGRKGEETSKETPGRIFRKLWRKMTEPINKVGERIDELRQTLEASNEKHHNETLTKIKEWTGKSKGGECTKQIQQIHNTTKETAQKIGSIEMRQASVEHVCSKILSEVERVSMKMGGSSFVPGVTEAYHEGPGEGYLATSCADLQRQGTRKTGIYTIKPQEAPEAFLAYCDLETEGGGWTVFQRRGDYGDGFRQNFTQNWEVYKRGFGDPQREFWIGNEKIFILSNQDDVKLRVELQDFDDNTAYAEYSRFKVEGEDMQYKLSVGGYQGNATDSLSLHDGKMFSTHDRDNDEVSSCCNCADTFKGGWWYYRCFEANLNGPYQTDPTDNGYFLGIIWEKWKGDYSLKSSEMKIRPLSFEDQVEDP